jgi:hypothetical protein
VIARVYLSDARGGFVGFDNGGIAAAGLAVLVVVTAGAAIALGPSAGQTNASTGLLDSLPATGR